LVVLVAILAARCGAPPGDAPATDTGIAAARSGRALEVEGVVTYADPTWQLYLLADSTGVIHVQPGVAEPHFRPGSVLRLAGSVRLVDGHPVLVAERLLAARDAELSEAPTVSGSAVAEGRFDGRRVRVSGVIDAARIEQARLRLDIVTADRRIVAWLRQGSASDAGPFLHQAVTVVGVPFR
jgi:hypothetical protein